VGISAEHVPEERARERPTPGVRVPAAVQQLLASAFGWWARARWGMSLGPGLGFVTERLHDLDLSGALPRDFPPHDLVGGRAAALANDSGPTEILRRANAWAGALEHHLHEVAVKRVPRGTVLTTYGFVWIRGAIRLSVVHYLPLMTAFAARPQKAIRLGNWEFPVVIRPWLPVQHRGLSAYDGNCWVKFVDDSGQRRPGVLTALHALEPRDAGLGIAVSVDVGRPVPPGVLRCSSAKMDAAVVEIEEHEWGSKVRAPHSTVVGYKPVRLMSRRPVDADVVEHSGLMGATIPGQAGQEPLNAAYLILNGWAEPGDSGCLIVDLEFTRRGHTPPYLLYLGVTGLKIGGKAGYGLLIEQANKVWDLECFR